MRVCVTLGECASEELGFSGTLSAFQQDSGVNLAVSLAALSYVDMHVHSRGPRWYLSERRFEDRVSECCSPDIVVHLSSSQSL